MKEWLKISILLSVFGFFRENRPSEPYGIEFMTGPWKNLTLEGITREAMPIGTYSHLSQLIIIFLITDYFKYKPLIVLSGLSGVVIWAVLTWTKTLFGIQIFQLFYGTYLATEVAYITYIYAKVDKKYYPKVTSHTRAALLIGKLVASISAQILIYFEWMNYMELNYITLASQSIATIWAIFLPNVTKTIYFHREKSLSNESKESEYGNSININNMASSTDNIIQSKNEENPFKLIYTHFKNAYTNRYVIQWSIWYAIVLCGYLQVTAYIQTLWKEIEKDLPIIWNGIVEAIFTFSGAICALSAGYLHAGRLSNTSSLLFLSVLSICNGCVILFTTLQHNLYFSYGGYAIFGAIYAFSITVASSEVAKHLEEDSFGLVFGVNTFIGLVIQTILTVLVVDGSVILLDIFGQYFVYSGYFITVGVSFCLFILFETCVAR
ncbi:thiamine transporter 1-like [Condylostylus longicornis]|uniref:thiamine transporter 1-like n=1 Tax=Condylostylus longicornis TaxID=2530218 RepID=UPI00244DA6D4|nr:thiamine transporter 1-like [Condylostylus longicornis]